MAQCVQDHRNQAEVHGRTRDHGAQQQAEEGVKRTGGEGNAQRGIEEGEEWILPDVAQDGFAPAARLKRPGRRERLGTLFLGHWGNSLLQILRAASADLLHQAHVVHSRRKRKSRPCRLRYPPHFPNPRSPVGHHLVSHKIHHRRIHLRRHVERSRMCERPQQWIRFSSISTRNRSPRRVRIKRRRAMSRSRQSDPRQFLRRRLVTHPVNRRLGWRSRLNRRTRQKWLGAHRRRLARDQRRIIRSNFRRRRYRQRTRRRRSFFLNFRFCGESYGICKSAWRALRKAEHQQGCSKKHRDHLSCRKLCELHRPRHSQYAVPEDRLHWPIGHIPCRTTV
jgi:hypothetical protein